MNTIYFKSIDLLTCSCNENKFRKNRCLKCNQKALVLESYQYKNKLLSYKFKTKENYLVVLEDNKIIVSFDILKGNYYKKFKRLINMKKQSFKVELTEENFLYEFKQLIYFLDKTEIFDLIHYYNQLSTKKEKILIYDRKNLSIHQTYLLVYLMFNYPKLANIQEYFKSNALLSIFYSEHLNKKTVKVNNANLEYILFLLENNVKKRFNERIDYSKNKVHQMMRLSKEYLIHLKESNSMREILQKSVSSRSDLYNIVLHNHYFLQKETVLYNQLFSPTYPVRELEKFMNSYTKKSKKNVKQVLLDIKNEVENEKNYYYSTHDMIQSYIDYQEMSEEIGLDYKESLKNIDLEHDLVVELYNEQMHLKHSKKISFKKIYEQSNYEDEINDYILMKPNDSLDLIREGYFLHHCVGSYVDKVYNKDCLIYFLRKKDELDKSLVTIEVRQINGQYNKIVQAKGKYNRELLKQELEVIELWAEKHNLVISSYL